MRINKLRTKARKSKLSTMSSPEFTRSETCSEDSDFNNNVIRKHERTEDFSGRLVPENDSESVFSRRKLSVSKLVMAFVVLLFSFSCINASPVFLGGPGFNFNAQMSMARNIRHLPCISRKTGDEGVCMFAIDCLKANGSHLGTCIDRFYFGSCCQISDKTIVPQVVSNNIEDNTIFGSTYLTPEKTEKPDSNEIPPLQPLGKPVGAPTTTTSSKAPTQTTTESTKATSTEQSSTMSIENKTHPTSEVTAKTTSAESVATSTSSPTTTQATTRKPVFHMSTRKPITTPKPASSLNHTTEVPFKLSTYQTISEDIAKATDEPSILNVTLTTETPITTAILHTTEIPTNFIHKPVLPFNKPNVTHTKNPTTTTSQKPQQTSQKPQQTSQKPQQTSQKTPQTSQKPQQTSQKPQQTSTIKPTTAQVKPQRPIYKPSQKPTTSKPLPFGTRLTTKPPTKPTTQISATVQDLNINTTSSGKPPTPTKPAKPVLQFSTTKKPIYKPTTSKPIITKKPILTQNTTSYINSNSTPIQRVPTTTAKPTKPIQVSTTIAASTKPITTLSSETTTMESKPTTLQSQSTTLETKPETTTKQVPVTTNTLKPSPTTQKSTTQKSTNKPSTTSTTSSTTSSTTASTTTTTEKITTSNPTINEVVDTQVGPSLDVVKPEESTVHPPGLVTWTNSIDAVTLPTALVNATSSAEDTWSPITPPDGWVLISTVSPQPDSTTSSTTSKPQLISNITKPEETLLNTTTSANDSISELVDVKIPIELTSAIPSISISDILNGSDVTTESPVVTETGNFSANYSTQSEASSTESTASSSTHKSTVSPIEAVTTSLPTIPPSINMTDYKDVCGRRLWPEPRIVGGAKSSFGKWPWQISLRQWRTSTYLHKCGAALLNENWAITAAHCVEHVPPSDLLVRLGEHDLAHEEEPYGFQERRVQIVASHPHFDPATFEYDLALLRFYEPVTFQPNILPVCVPQSDDNFVGKTAYVTGWGRLYDDGPLPSVLQEVSVPVINNTLCESMYRSAGFNEHIPNIFICAGWKKGGFDSCEGDSGGPMVLQRQDNRFLLAGVISWGIGCAEPNQPGVYTRISEFRDWINQILQF